ncbi:hypothetical protein VNO77_02068 [Canavalia gladiata]|uniref:Uncharacterized protein n=1 Tax=Canavalia gladiata TaxID=3824 RepID=A0AAN9R5K3_CANGL
MNKFVEQLGFAVEEFGDPALMRVLIARSMGMDKTAKAFMQWHNNSGSLGPDCSFGMSPLEVYICPSTRQPYAYVKINLDREYNCNLRGGD